MKRALYLLFFLLSAASQLECDRSSPTGPPKSDVLARIGVYVHFGGSGVPGIQVELVETGEKRVTDASGRVEFQVPGGEYVVRVYGLTRPGPGSRTEDYTIAVKPGLQETIKVFDCLPCV